MSPKGVVAIFERLRHVLHEAEIDKRVQYMIEVMFATRKDGFKVGSASVFLSVCPGLSSFSLRTQNFHQKFRASCLCQWPFSFSLSFFLFPFAWADLNSSPKSNFAENFQFVVPIRNITAFLYQIWKIATDLQSDFRLNGTRLQMLALYSLETTPIPKYFLANQKAEVVQILRKCMTYFVCLISIFALGILSISQLTSRQQD